MAETKGTPGPWKQRATHVYSAAGNVCSASDPRASTVVGYSPPTLERCDDPEIAANLNLITAAPDIFEALKRAKVALAAYRRNDPRPLFEGEDWPLMKRIEAALAKAEGVVP